ncbi:MAG TPA: lysophospholipid acyltransferase family protein [Thermoanaerobaculia bacterium]|nr:lysophospholipid acyltransferase family protein [Thermoanaerobaculia bacterium]
MAPLNNPITLGVVRAIFALTSSNTVLGRERIPRDHDGLLLACTHLSYYDPLTVSVLLGREVDWMARDEYFARWYNNWLIRKSGGFPIARFGPALPGIRESLRRLERGRLVGMYPEGEVLWGSASVLNGAPTKEGVGLLARRAQVPVVPCVTLNSDQFKRLSRWLPLRTGRLWIGFGHPIEPDLSLPPGRASRREITQRVGEGLRETYRELLAAVQPPESVWA